MYFMQTLLLKQSDELFPYEYRLKDEKIVVHYPSLHAHDFYEMFILLDGSFKHYICGKTIYMQKGDVVFIKPGESHGFDYVTKETPTVLTLCLTEDLLNRFTYIGEGELKYYFSFETSGVVSLCETDFEAFMTTYENFKTSRNAAKDMLFSALLSILFFGLFKKVYKIQPQNNTSSFEDILGEMNTPENIREGLPALLRLTSFSDRQIRRIMKMRYNTTPQMFITKLRMNYAKNLLIHTDKDILTISLEIGYSSVNSFINQFKAAYNITPGKFRNNYRKALYT